MAKKSAVNRNEMVRKLVKQYAGKRDALKAIANDDNRPWKSVSRLGCNSPPCRATPPRCASATVATSPGARAPFIAPSR